MAENSPALLALLDAECCFQWANLSWCRALGWSPSALVGRTFDSLVHPDDREGVLLSRAGASSAPERARHRARIQHGDGGWRWVDWFVAAFARGQFYARELTEVIAAEEHLQRRLQLVDLAEEIAGVGHWSVDVTSSQVSWSPQVYRIYGLDPAGPPPTLSEAIDAYHVDDRARVSDLVGEAIERGRPFAFELRLVRPTGEVRHVVSRGRCVVDASTGRTHTMFGTFLDVTERDQEREQLARERRLVTLGAMAAGVGHEMNNPLTFVSTSVDALVEELQEFVLYAPTERGQTCLDLLADARQGVDRMIQISRSLREFSRDDAPLRPTSLRRVVDLAVALSEHEFRHRATCVVDLGDVPHVEADEARVAQALVNLLANAAQSFETYEPDRNTVRVEARHDEAGRVTVTVRDNGPGIPPAALPHIFEPFFTTRPSGQGRGLGLTIAQSIVHGVGGELRVESAPGVGTTFTVTLLAAKESAAAPQPGDASTDARCVVVVDDERALVDAFTRVLRREGYRVVGFVDPRAALDYLATNAVDVVVSDVVMPTLNGMRLYPLRGRAATGARGAVRLRQRRYDRPCARGVPEALRGAAPRQAVSQFGTLRERARGDRRVAVTSADVTSSNRRRDRRARAVTG